MSGRRSGLKTVTRRRDGFVKLVLFDIDGTIMNTGGAGARPFLQALEQVYGKPVEAEGYAYGGKTDTQITLELAERMGVSREEAEAGLAGVRERYLSGLAIEMAECTPRICPGIPDLLARLSGRPEVLLGLLTGNVRRGAEIKLKCVGMWKFFQTGAFGDRATDRRLLPDEAREAAFVLTGRRFEGSEMVVIGDTPNDVLCGKHLGVSTIAVATGSYNTEDLAPHKPDWLFEDLSDTDRVESAILEPGSGRGSPTPS